MLAAADEQELLVLSLKQAHAEGKIDGHDPELGIAGEMAVQWIDDEDEEQVDMQDENRCDGHWDLSHPDDRMVPLCPKDAT